MSSWEDTRARLNHDILRNQVLNEVMALENDPARECPRLGMWLKYQDAYEKMLDDTESETGYAGILKSELFDCYDDEMRAKVSEMLEQLFLCKTNVREKVVTCRKTLEEALQATKRVLATGPEERTVSDVRNLSELLHQLSNQISALPRSWDISNGI